MKKERKTWRRGRGVILEVEAPHHVKKTTPLQRGGFTWSFLFFLFGLAREDARRCAPHYVWDAASGTRRAPKWTRIELQVINLWKAPLERGVLSQAFVFICQDMYSDMRRKAFRGRSFSHVRKQQLRLY